MVAVISLGASIRRSFLYNEHKIKAGVAQCLLAANYPCDLSQLDENMRLNMLLRTAALHPQSQKNSLHISLNFATDEKLNDALLREIASSYMEQIGFGEQPFLVYRHDDAAHPHVHILSTTITPKGERIATHNMARDRSEPARKYIEEQYHLVRAQDHHIDQYQLQPIDAARVIYGKQPTRKAISTVLQNVLGNYRFTSLSELNAVLEQYNVTANRGEKGSRIFSHQGLLYQALDASGRPVGTPIKASLFHNKPGLKELDKYFVRNAMARQGQQQRLKNDIDLLLFKQPKMSLEQFSQKLKALGIYLAIRSNEKGQVYGLTYVDHRTRCVFNGSDIGKNYSAKAILDRLQNPPTNTYSKVGEKVSIAPQTSNIHHNPAPLNLNQQAPESLHEKGLIEQLMASEEHAELVPQQWKRKKKKKKKRS